MSSTTFEAHGYVIDLERLYEAMYDLRVVEGDQVVFNGSRGQVRGKPMRAMKRLLHDLFDVPATDNYHYTGNRVRTAAREHLESLGWATNDPRGSAKYILHRELDGRAFLLTWNPGRGFLWPERSEVLRQTNAGHAVPAEWSVGRRTSGFSVGDVVYLMRLGDGPRGIVASGTIIDPTVRRAAHWNGEKGKLANYVGLAWDRAVDDSELLPEDVLRSAMPKSDWAPQAGGVQLDATVAQTLLGLWTGLAPDSPRTEPTDRRQAREAGYIADAAVRTAIEKHAERICAEYYEDEGYTVDFVGAFRAYDIHAVHRITGEVRHVEVKGSSGRGEAVELTAGEVDHAVTYQPTDLFVVAQINWRVDGTQVLPSGGIATRHSDWLPASDDLTAVRFRYRVPEDGATV